MTKKAGRGKEKVREERRGIIIISTAIINKINYFAITGVYYKC